MVLQSLILLSVGFNLLPPVQCKVLVHDLPLLWNRKGNPASSAGCCIRGVLPESEAAYNQDLMGMKGLHFVVFFDSSLFEGWLYCTEPDISILA
jgi:hypothetical protein